MKALRHILNAAGFTTGLLLVLAGLARFGASRDPIYPAVKTRWDNLFRQRHEIEALAVGHSHCRGIDFETLGIRGYHVWEGGGDAFETEYIVRHLMPRLPNLKVVFYPASYFTFYFDNAASDDQDRNSNRIKTYAYCPGWTWIRGDWRNFIKGKLINVIRPERDYLFELLYKNPPAAERVYLREHDGASTAPGLFEPRTLEELISLSETNRAGEHQRLILDMGKNHRHLAKDARKSVERTLKDLRKHDIQVVFFTPPYFYRYTELFNPDLVAEQRAVTAELAEKYGGVYYDFSMEPDFIHNHQMFRDEDHLNLKYGAPEFSRRLRARLEEDGILP